MRKSQISRFSAIVLFLTPLSPLSAQTVRLLRVIFNSDSILVEANTIKKVDKPEYWASGWVRISGDGGIKPLYNREFYQVDCRSNRFNLAIDIEVYANKSPVKTDFPVQITQFKDGDATSAIRDVICRAAW